MFSALLRKTVKQICFRRKYTLFLLNVYTKRIKIRFFYKIYSKIFVIFKITPYLCLREFIKRTITTTFFHNKLKNSIMNFKEFLHYIVRDINNDFRIKVSGFDPTTGRRVNTLVGVNGLVNFIGIELANKFLDRAYRLDFETCCVCKLRRGLKVSFYLK